MVLIPGAICSYLEHSSELPVSPVDVVIIDGQAKMFGFPGPRMKDTTVRAIQVGYLHGLLDSVTPDNMIRWMMGMKSSSLNMLQNADYCNSDNTLLTVIIHCSQ